MEDLVSLFYRDYYTRVFNDKGITGLSFNMTHKLVESNYFKFTRKRNSGAIKSSGPEILEIGAGKAEHLPYVSTNFQKYVMFDLFDPPEFYAGINDPRVSWIVGDICSYDQFEEKYDRIIIMCVLHHIKDLSTALRNISNLIKPGGTISIFLPSDPGLLNRLNRKLFVTPKARKLGFHDYELVNAIEHRNHYNSIIKQMEHIFSGFEIAKKHYPLNIPNQDLSLFSIWNISLPKY